jgi:hypothetical protein
MNQQEDLHINDTKTQTSVCVVCDEECFDVLPCSHIVHTSCIARAGQSTCSICRIDISHVMSPNDHQLRIHAQNERRRQEEILNREAAADIARQQQLENDEEEDEDDFEERDIRRRRVPIHRVIMRPNRRRIPIHEEHDQNHVEQQVNLHPTTRIRNTLIHITPFVNMNQADLMTELLRLAQSIDTREAEIHVSDGSYRFYNLITLLRALALELGLEVQEMIDVLTIATSN